MKIIVLGLRGFPGVQGGVETHAEHLYPLMANLGCAVEVVGRSPYLTLPKDGQWQGVTLSRLWCPRHKDLEALVHTFIGVLYAAVRRPDILHLHAIGPAIMTPLARLLGLRVVVTHHGPDYDRQKWGRFPRWILRIGERLGMRYAHRRIAISEVIRQLVRKNHQRDCALIPNGVALPRLAETSTVLEKFDLNPGRYLLFVSRLVPEKRHLDLIKAFAMANLPEWKLVLVGGSDHPDEYMREVIELGRDTANVVLTGFQTGVSLQELYTHAGMFVLPSSHEGLPIVLLEALSYGLPVIASDIPANLEVGLEQDQYFPLGECAALAGMLERRARIPLDRESREKSRTWVTERYDWTAIARLTLDVYRSVAPAVRPRR